MTAFSDLRFVALGGAGEIGVNAYLYGLEGRWLMVDLGIGFADDRLPGVDIVLPDLRFIEEQRSALDGIVITHAHEDHVGAVPYLWQRLGCPVWCTPFAAAVLRAKLAETEIAREVPINVVEPGERFRVGGFECRFVHVTHSIPDSNALVLDTPFGRVLHTGDWKLDPAPLVGARTDVATLEAVGREGVLALVGDSTNVLSPGTSGSEAEVRESLTRLIADQPYRVVLTTFSSNIARLETAMLAAHAAGREIFVVGRSMRRMIEAAREVGYLKDIPPIRDEREAELLPRDRVLYLCTGSQGESRSALVRIAGHQHPRVRLEPGDAVIFSAKIIPGNERTLYNLHNQLVRSGIEVITEVDHFVHVSGHPCRDEVEQMYRWIKPKIAIPVHGEARHLHAHQRLAQDLGIEHAVLIENGDVLRIAPGAPEVVDEIPVGRMVMETDGLVEAGDDLFRTRRRLMNHGTILVSLVLDEEGSILAPPQLTPLGAFEADRFGEIKGQVCDAIADAVEDMSDEAVRDDERVREIVRVALRQALDLPRHRRPIVEVQITRLSAETLAALEE
ncbi:ribonuclease J [Benzoatithermus flavus]|uniref:Ribonuclease J n=1 Tax=Benzoatithermus flavus TaxID=3108223 RepID=A0ABU8XKB7_9PROT